MVIPFDLGGENVLVEIGTIHNDWSRGASKRRSATGKDYPP
jgi:hypothetical protein